MNDASSEAMVPPRKFLRTCRRNMRRVKVADSNKTEMTGADLLTRSLILRRLLRREVLAANEKHVGLLLPPSVPAVVANAALSIDRRIAVNLNYTVSTDVMNDCIRQCDIRHVLTSRRVMEKFDFEIDAELVYLEDFKEKVTLTDKLLCAAAAWAMPVSMLERRLGLTEIDQDDVLTVIFTSGSTGMPKGVMLTHRNIGSNVEAFNAAVLLDRHDVLTGILPLFHSFGYTTNLWPALILEPQVVFHYSPLEARPIGKLCRKYGATILIATPTFLRSYVRRCKPEDFATMEVVLTGAEKLPIDLIDAFEKKFGIRPVEGYGATELSPVAAVNVPPKRVSQAIGNGCKEGTIGQPLPGVSAKIVDLDTGEDLPPGKAGMLLVSGPNVMKGYLGKPDLTAKVIRGDWYVTGDVALIDEEGYIQITGRQSRFSKIGGEMVPHIRIEEEILKIIQTDEGETDDEQDTVAVAVTAVPDARKGERLIVLHTGLAQEPKDLCRQLSAAGLPPIWIPSPASFRKIDRMPVLGTGKLDLKGIKEKALAEFASGE